MNSQVFQRLDGAIVKPRYIRVFVVARVDFEDQLFRFTYFLGVVHVD